MRVGNHIRQTIEAKRKAEIKVGGDARREEILRDLNILEKKVHELYGEIGRLEIKGYNLIIGREEQGERIRISFSDFFLSRHVYSRGHPMLGGSGGVSYELVNKNAGGYYSAELSDLEQYFGPSGDVTTPPDESRTCYFEEWDMTLPKRFIYDLFLYDFDRDSIRFLIHYLQLFNLPIDSDQLDWLHECAEHIDGLWNMNHSDRPIGFGQVCSYEDKKFSLAELQDTFLRIKHGNLLV